MKNAIGCSLKVRELPAHALYSGVRLVTASAETKRRILEALHDQFQRAYPDRIGNINVDFEATATVFQLPGDPEQTHGATWQVKCDLSEIRDKLLRRPERKKK